MQSFVQTLNICKVCGIPLHAGQHVCHRVCHERAFSAFANPALCDNIRCAHTWEKVAPNDGHSYIVRCNNASNGHPLCMKCNQKFQSNLREGHYAEFTFITSDLCSAVNPNRPAVVVPKSIQSKTELKQTAPQCEKVEPSSNYLPMGPWKMGPPKTCTTKVIEQERLAEKVRLDELSIVTAKSTKEHWADVGCVNEHNPFITECLREQRGDAMDDQFHLQDDVIAPDGHICRVSTMKTRDTNHYETHILYHSGGHDVIEVNGNDRNAAVDGHYDVCQRVESGDLRV